MHGQAKAIDMDFLTLLQLMKFLQFEGKAVEVNGKPISVFEHRLYQACHEKMIESTENETIEQKFLIGLVLSEFDSYDGSFLKVRNIHYK